eukprot:TRINITY_DN12427_c0_g1_i11.p3 TRINITY_DN12427_c0_g1~~TRINITY_DN12427_c0_g1_i11.p3  ORF type:complete len:178 (+),score=13.06 TRINITY_DN12427_c0_g1_i11:910-1443(+)
MAGLLQLEAWYQANTRPNKCAILTNYKELYRLAQASGISVQAPLNNRSTKAELTAAVHELLDKLNAATQANAGLGPSAVVASTAAMQSASNSSGAAMRAITPLETSGQSDCQLHSPIHALLHLFPALCQLHHLNQRCNQLRQRPCPVLQLHHLNQRCNQLHNRPRQRLCPVLLQVPG